MMKYYRVIFKENNKGITKYYVLGLEERTFFDSLIKFLEKYYEAEIISKNEGLITRFWQLRIKEECIMVEHHEDMGNCFYSCDYKNEESDLANLIANDLTQRLKNVSYV